MTDHSTSSTSSTAATTPKPVREVLVRAAPAQGRPTYWRAGVPWPRHEVRVRIVDDPAPLDPMIGYATEIHPSDLRKLEKDRRIVVQPLFADGSDPRELIVLQGQMHQVATETARTREELATAQAELGHIEAVRQQAEAAAHEGQARIAALETELAGLRVQLATDGKRSSK